MAGALLNGPGAPAVSAVENILNAEAAHG